MDSFFRAEAIAGVQRLLRQGRGLNEAIENGIRDGKEAIRIWNSRREWQVHRWDGWIESFLQETIRRVRSKL